MLNVKSLVCLAPVVERCVNMGRGMSCTSENLDSCAPISRQCHYGLKQETYYQAMRLAQRRKLVRKYTAAAEQRVVCAHR